MNPTEDHDILIEIKGDVKHLVNTLKDHIISDDKVQKEIKSNLDFHQKIVYGGIGILGFVEFIRSFIH